MYFEGVVDELRKLPGIEAFFLKSVSDFAYEPDDFGNLILQKLVIGFRFGHWARDDNFSLLNKDYRERVKINR